MHDRFEETEEEKEGTTLITPIPPSINGGSQAVPSVQKATKFINTAKSTSNAGAATIFNTTTATRKPLQARKHLEEKKESSPPLKLKLRNTPEKCLNQTSNNTSNVNSSKDFLDWLGVDKSSEDDETRMIPVSNFPSSQYFDQQLNSHISACQETLTSASNMECDIDLLFVIDFECNQPEKEIIEFPICVIDIQSQTIIDTFHAFVRPTINTQLTPFILELTGILQNEVDASDDLRTVLLQASQFIEKHIKNRNSKAVSILYDCPADARFLSEEIRKKQIPIFNADFSSLFMSFINLRNVFPIELTGGVQNISMQHALEVLGLTFLGKKHTGKDDATNIARVCIELLKRNAVKFTSDMKQSQFLVDTEPPKKQLKSPTINDVFTMNRYMLAIDGIFQVEADFVHCKYIQIILFQRNQEGEENKDSEQNTSGYTLVDNYTKTFGGTNAMLEQQYFEFMQELQRFSGKHGISHANSFAILNTRSSIKKFQQLLKSLASIPFISQTCSDPNMLTNFFQFRNKIYNVFKLLCNQIIISKEKANEILETSFPQNVIKLAELFKESNYSIKEIEFQPNYGHNNNNPFYSQQSSQANYPFQQSQTSSLQQQFQQQPQSLSQNDFHYVNAYPPLPNGMGHNQQQQQHDRKQELLMNNFGFPFSTADVHYLNEYLASNPQINQNIFINPIEAQQFMYQMLAQQQMYQNNMIGGYSQFQQQAYHGYPQLYMQMQQNQQQQHSSSQKSIDDPNDEILRQLHIQPRKQHPQQRHPTTNTTTTSATLISHTENNIHYTQNHGGRGKHQKNISFGGTSIGGTVTQSMQIASASHIAGETTNGSSIRHHSYRQKFHKK